MSQNYWSKKLANNSSKWIANWIKILKINKELKRKAKCIPLHIFLQSASYPHPHVELLCHQERQTPVSIKRKREKVSFDRSLALLLRVTCNFEDRPRIVPELEFYTLFCLLHVEISQDRELLINNSLTSWAHHLCVPI